MIFPAWLAPSSLLVSLAVGLSGFLGGVAYEHFDNKREQELLTLQAAVDVAADKEKLRDEHRTIQDELLRQIAGANARADDLVVQLRDRPDRLPVAARAACKGVTGAELSGRDSAAFVRLGRRAEAIRLELQACIEQETKNYNALKPK